MIREKDRTDGDWARRAIIMAQTTLNIYISDAFYKCVFGLAGFFRFERS